MTSSEVHVNTEPTNETIEMARLQRPRSPLWGVRYPRSWAATEIAHPADAGEHGDCVHCLDLAQEVIAKAIVNGQTTATVEHDGHSLTMHQMIGSSHYIEPGQFRRPVVVEDEDDLGCNRCGKPTGGGNQWCDRCVLELGM